MNEKLHVYYDGSCAMCRRYRSWVESRDEEDRIRFVNSRIINDDALPESRHLLLSRIVVEKDGFLSTGYDALCDILTELPRWHSVAPILKLQPFAMAGRILYRFIAANRFRFGGQGNEEGEVKHESKS